MTPLDQRNLDQWSLDTFPDVSDYTTVSMTLDHQGVRILTPQQSEERDRLHRIRFARGPGTRRFAQFMYHTTMAALLLAVIVGLYLAARGLTP